MYLRAADESDGPVLSDALLQAFNWSGNHDFTREEILGIPEISHYISGWKRYSDFGSVAHDDQGQPVGAAWGRLFSPGDRGYGFVSETIPELSMGVLPGHRGSGIGTALMSAVIHQATELGFTALSLSVEDENPAIRLYLRAGFRKVDRTGSSDTMLLQLG